VRRLGPYDANVVPSFSTLIQDLTPIQKAALSPLLSVVDSACAAYDLAAPDVHNLQPISVIKDEHDALVDGYDRRTVAVKRQLAKMIASLPKADADLCPLLLPRHQSGTGSFSSQSNLSGVFSSRTQSTANLHTLQS